MTRTIEKAYLDRLPASGLREKSQKEAKHAVKAFRSWRAKREITEPLLMKWRDHLGARELSDSYRNLQMALVGSMLRKAVRRGELDMDEAAIGRALQPFAVDRDPPRVLTRDEIARLARVCLDHGQTGRTALWLLCSGMRHKEALALRDEHVNEHGVMIPAINSKNHDGRVLPTMILGHALGALQPLPLKWNSTDWKKIREASGLKIPVKALRSTWVTYALSRGVLNPWQVCKLAGHSLHVSEQNYQGAPIFGLEGDTAPEWLGINDLLVVYSREG